MTKKKLPVGWSLLATLFYVVALVAAFYFGKNDPQGHPLWYFLIFAVVCALLQHVGRSVDDHNRREFGDY